jgi:geranylgeranyl reductase family protein
MTEFGSENRFDICIIGASIAGNYLSYLLSNSSLRIAVIEEHEKIGKPLQCAGIVSQKLNKLISLPKGVVLNRVKIARLNFPSNNSIELSGNEHPYIIDRIKLDQTFYEKVKDNPNISFFLGEKFKSFKYIDANKNENQKFLIIKTSKRQIKAKLLIGCDGPLSSIAKRLDIRNKIIYATQIRITGEFNENKAYLYFDERWNELFGWIVPEGNKIYKIGLACSKNIMKNFKLFLNKLGVNYKNKIDQQGGIIPIGTMNKLAHNNILLLGDAACMVKATTGGGIIMLLIAANIAAKCILKCFQTNNYSKKFIRKHYQKPCEATIGKELKLHYIVRTILKNFTNQDYYKIYNIMKKNEIRKLISVYGDMDFPKKLAFKLIFNSEFIRFLIKFIIKNPGLVIKMISIFLT